MFGVIAEKIVEKSIGMISLMLIPKIQSKSYLLDLYFRQKLFIRIFSIFLGCTSGLVYGDVIKEPVNLPYTYDWQEKFAPLASVFSFNDTHVWVAGDSNRILFTEDGGVSWQVQISPLPRSTYLKSIYFVSEDIGFAVGSEGRIIATRDGGVTWLVKGQSPVISDLNDVFFLNEKMGWVVGEGGARLRTIDGGSTWLEYEKPASGTERHNLNAVWFTSDLDGWAVGKDRVIRTSDGGRSWQYHRVGLSLRQQQPGGDVDHYLGETKIPDEFHFNDVFFSGPDEGWIIGDGGIVMHTLDGGASWNIKKLGSWPRNLKSISFLDENNGIIVGQYNAIWTTNDGGNDWNEISTDDLSSDSGQLEAVASTDNKKAWVVSNNGDIYSSEDAGSTWTPQRKSIRIFGNGRRGDLNAIQFMTNNVGWAAGGDWNLGSADIIKTEDGGNTWSNAHASLGGRSNFDGLAYHRSLYFLNENRGLAVGDHRLFLSTDDGGSSWDAEYTDLTTEPLTSLYFIDDFFGWAVGKNGAALLSTDSGRSWNSSSTGINSSSMLYDVFFTDKMHGWIATVGGIYKTNDGGNTWRANEIVPGVKFKAIYFHDERKGWLVGNDGHIMVSEDGGETWVRQLSGVEFNIEDVFFWNAYFGIVVGSSSNTAGLVQPILMTFDGGNTWKKQSRASSKGINLRALDSLPSRRIFAVGESGVIIEGIPSNKSAWANTFSVKQSPNGTKLRWSIEDENVSSVVSSVDFSLAGTENWAQIDKKVEFLSENERQLVWSPGKYVPTDASLKYRLKLADESGIVYYQEIQGTYKHASWWSTLDSTLKTLVVLTLGVSFYLIIVGLTYVLAPGFLVILRKKMYIDNASEFTRSFGNIFLPLQVLVASTLIPFVSKTQRARKGWIEYFEQGRVNFDDLPVDLQKDYLKYDDWELAWLKKYLSNEVSIRDMPALFRQKLVGSESFLDAWVTKRIPLAVTALERIQVVSNRPERSFIPTPIEILDEVTNEKYRVSNPADKGLRAVFEREVSVVSIEGVGGAGKSTLACHLSRRALSSDKDSRLAPHLMIPVFLMEDTTSLISSIRNQLRVMIGEEDLEEDILINLLQYKRLLVVFDSLSEQSSACQDHVSTIHSIVPINALIVTSRQAVSFSPVLKTSIGLVPINEKTLVYFLTEHLMRTGAESIFPGRKLLALADRLMILSERSHTGLAITPLLITIFVDNAVESGLQEIDEVSGSLPETFLEYLRRLFRSSEDRAQFGREEEFITACRTLGHMSLGEHYVPRSFDRKSAVRALFELDLSENESDKLLEFLVLNTVLEISDIGGTNYFSFRWDPLAEYLGALYLIDRFRGDEVLWKNWEKKLIGVEGFPEETNGFLVALQETTSAYRDQLEIPSLTSV